jgi:hypothetical protein
VIKDNTVSACLLSIGILAFGALSNHVRHAVALKQLVSQGRNNEER